MVGVDAEIDEKDVATEAGGMIEVMNDVGVALNEDMVLVDRNAQHWRL